MNLISSEELPACKVVAEGCCNHMGSIDLAKKMTEVAKECGADYIKWQKRNPEESVKKEILNNPHPCPENSYGKTYLEHRKNLEFDHKQHYHLKKHAERIGIGYSTSVWDLTSAKEVIEYCNHFVKVPSAANLNFELIEWLLDNYKGKVHISLGMLSWSKREEIFKRFFHYNDKIVYYHTTTVYPCEFENLYLGDLKYLSSKFDEIGFSGHHKGIAMDIMAYAWGAQWIERHFTLDRTFKGTDHAASVEPSGLSKLVRDLKAAKLSSKVKTEVPEQEKNSENKLRVPQQYIDK